MLPTRRCCRSCFPPAHIILAGEKPAGRQRPLPLLHTYALQLLFNLGLERTIRQSEMYTLSKGNNALGKCTFFLGKMTSDDKRQVLLSIVAKSLL